METEWLTVDGNQSHTGSGDTVNDYNVWLKKEMVNWLRYKSANYDGQFVFERNLGEKLEWF